MNTSLIKQSIFYRWKVIVIFLFLSFLATSILFAQEQKVSGRITSEDTKEPLPGVNVLIKGTYNGTITNSEGNFVLNVLSGSTLVISSIGYVTTEVSVGAETMLNIVLKVDVAQLNEVVIIGYDTRERKNIVGSISKFDPTETKSIPVGSFDAQLQGKVAGVQITSNTGVPGEAVAVRVRGATSINADVSSLYVVDGVFINSNSLQTINTGGKATSPIADINPSDIESIEVLKDASATALYGSRGANGVIIVTTKRGNFEQKPTINFNASNGWAKAAKLWELTTGPEHATLVNEWWINTGGDNPTLNRTFANRPFRLVSELVNGQPGRGLPEEQQTYDRLSEIFRTAKLKNYDLSLAGGTKSTKYYLAGGYNSQEAILRPLTFERISFKLNLDQKINDKVQVGVSNTITSTYRNQGRAGDGPSGGLLQAALHTPTYLSPFNDQGVLVGRAGFDNVTLLINNYDVNTTSLRYIGILYLEAELLPSLKFRTSVSADYNNYEESEYWNTFLIEGGTTGLGRSTLTRRAVLLNEQTLSYRKEFNKHSLGVLVGNTLQSDVTNRTSAEGRGFANNSIKLISQASTRNSSQDWTKATLASFFARVDYSYADKYLVDFSLRADGSSRFGANNRFGYFPSVGAAWRVKQEGFLQDINFISDLKLRTSYGVTGNQNFQDFPGQGLWAADASYQGNPGIRPSQLANANLKWEQTSQFNIGVDVSILEKRLSFEFNYYNKYTKDGLTNLPISTKTGFSSIASNGIEISNKGFELGIKSVNLSKGGVTWITSFNVAQNLNKIEKLATPIEFGSRSLILQKEGSPLYSFWVYKQLYVDPQTGNAVYEDVDGKAGITSADRQLVGSFWPKFFGGITNDITYKGFDVSLFFSYSCGNKIYNHNRFFGEAGGARDAARIIFKNNLNRWQKPGDITDVPRPDGINVNNYLDGGSRFLEDGSYLRLRSLTVGYTLPTSVAKRLRLEKLRFYAVGTNLFLFTKYTGLDPEASANSSQNQPGIDLGTPPQPVGVQIGLDLKL